MNSTGVKILIASIFLCVLVWFSVRATVYPVTYDSTGNPGNITGYYDARWATNIPWSGMSPATVPSSALPIRAGFQAIGNLATSQAVTFTTPLASAVGTNYSVSISSDSTLASAVGFSATSKTTNGFTITLSAGVTGGIGVDYTAIPYQ